MNKAIKSVFATTLAVAASLSPIAVSAWGDNAGGRRSYTIDEINSGVLGSKIVMNSINDKNDPIGDEKNFVGARLDGSTNSWQGNEISVESDKTYIVRLYVHNNNPGAYSAVAKDVKTTFSVPTTSGSSVEVNGFIDSSNATPSSYWDNVVFKSKNGENFHLEYIAGSALLENNGVAKGGLKLSDDLVKTGVKIGYDALDGNIPGCFQYASYVTMKVKAVFDDSEKYTVNKTVRLVGDKDWKESVTAKVGDKVEFQIEYKNTSNTTQNDVTVKDVLPANLSYVAGTTKLYNAKYTSGLKADDDLTKNGLGIGAYTAGSNAFIRFTAEVKDTSLNCGENTLNNWAQVSINGKKVLQDPAAVVVNKACKNPDPVKPDPVLPNTGAGEIMGAALGAGSIVTSLGYYVASRKRF